MRVESGGESVMRGGEKIGTRAVAPGTTRRADTGGLPLDLGVREVWSPYVVRLFV